jgi:hypothetical protein
MYSKLKELESLEIVEHIEIPLEWKGLEYLLAMAATLQRGPLEY